MKIVLGPAGGNTAVDVLAVPLAEEDLERDAVLGEIDRALGGALRGQIREEEFTGKRDAVLVLPTLGRVAARRVLLLGLGPAAKVTTVELRAAVAKAARMAQAERATSLAVVLPGKGDAAEIRAGAEGVLLGGYRFTKYLTGDRRPKKALERVILGWRGVREGTKPTAEQKRGLLHGEGVAAAVNLVRDLVNEPANELPPGKLAEAAVAVARRYGMGVKVLDRAKIRAAGMKLLDAVGRGSRNEPCFVHMSYVPAKARKGRKRVVLVGKGLTFDSGGLCIKQAAGMGEMKADMAGAGLAIGAMAAVGVLKPDVEVHALIAAAENMPDGDAYRPGDVFGSLDGKTVEIVNTDAEGRLVLADALAYGRKLQPDVMIDHATLTGACMVALGTLTAGFYATDEGVAEGYLAAARAAGESMWRMPLLDELRDGLKSEVADVKHTGDRWGGSITAALFLREFVGDAKWVHVDIAGPAFLDRLTAWSPKGATGYGVLSFVTYLERLAG